MSDPAPLGATYRLQLHRGFTLVHARAIVPSGGPRPRRVMTLVHARAIVPYLARLGVSHI